MATDISVFEKFRCIVAEKFDIDEDQITPNTDLRDDLGMDSLDLVDILMSIEDEFGVYLSDEDVCEKAYYGNFQDAVNLIENAIRLKGTSS